MQKLCVVLIRQVKQAKDILTQTWSNMRERDTGLDQNQNYSAYKGYHHILNKEELELIGELHLIMYMELCVDVPNLDYS